MSSLSFKAKIKKSDFEQKLGITFGIDDLTASPYEERTGEEGRTQKLTLYYFKQRHVATWTKGEGWIFKLPCGCLKHGECPECDGTPEIYK